MHMYTKRYIKCTEWQTEKEYTFLHLPAAGADAALQALWGGVGAVKATLQDGSMDNWW